MNTKFIPVSDAVPGMIVAEDIYTFNNILLIDRGAALTDRVITRLMFYNIDQIEIVDSNDAQPSENFEIDLLENISDSEKEFIKDFNKSTTKCVATFKTSLNDTFINNSQLDNSNLLKDLDSLVNQTRNALHLISLLGTMKKRDDVIFHHSINVALLASMLGNMLKLNDEDMNTLKLGAILHDVGKLAIPQQILSNNSRLSDKDYAIIKSHPTKGYELLSKQELPTSIKNMALMHHERCDGSGYPNGLMGSEIDKFAKMIAIIDCYEAMTSPRPYRDIISPFEVIEFFEQEGYRLFESEYFLPFINGVADSYINQKVLLTNGTKGTIVLINRISLSRPMIKLDRGGFIDLYTQRDVSIARVLV